MFWHTGYEETYQTLSRTSFHTRTHTHLWFDGAVDGWGAGGLHAPAAEGLGAGREGGVGDAVGHFMLQRWGALSVQLRSLLHLGQVKYHRHSQRSMRHNQSPHLTPTPMRPYMPTDNLNISTVGWCHAFVVDVL